MLCVSRCCRCWRFLATPGKRAVARMAWPAAAALSATVSSVSSPVSRNAECQGSIAWRRRSRRSPKRTAGRPSSWASVWASPRSRAYTDAGKTRSRSRWACSKSAASLWFQNLWARSPRSTWTPAEVDPTARWIAAPYRNPPMNGGERSSLRGAIQCASNLSGIETQNSRAWFFSRKKRNVM